MPHSMGALLVMVVLLLASGHTHGGHPVHDDRSSPSSPLNLHHEGDVLPQQWVVEVTGGREAIERVAERAGVQVVGQVAGGLLGNDKWLVEGAPAERVARDEGNQARWTPQEWHQMEPRGALLSGSDWHHPEDPLFKDQWHLWVSPGADSSDLNLSIESAWHAGFNGSGVQIAIVDDGFEPTHPDLDSSFYMAADSYDFNNNVPDPSPKRDRDGHGVCCAGTAVARAESHCGVGSAFGARYAGIRLVGGSTTDAQEATGLTFHLQQNHIFSMSWGPTDDGKHLEGPGPLLTQALKSGAKEGRGGLGTVWVWAAGNGAARSDNINKDGYANSIFTLTVGAVDRHGEVAYYSEGGTPLQVVAPSSGSDMRVTTSDRTGPNGASPGECTNGFGGTSAAAPMVAGVAALVLQSNGGLGWRDVQLILELSADRLGLEDTITTGAGHQWSYSSGFGVVNATRAVAVARQWVNVPAWVEHWSPLQEVGEVVTNLDPVGVMSTIVVEPGTSGWPAIVEHVMVRFSATHVARGEFDVTLTSPLGTKSRLLVPGIDTNANFSDWPLTSVVHLGESSAGNWTLTVRDMVHSSHPDGTMQAWQLMLSGANAPASVCPSSGVCHAEEEDECLESVGRCQAYPGVCMREARANLTPCSGGGFCMAGTCVMNQPSLWQRLMGLSRGTKVVGVAVAGGFVVGAVALTLRRRGGDGLGKGRWRSGSRNVSMALPAHTMADDDDNWLPSGNAYEMDDLFYEEEDDDSKPS